MTPEQLQSLWERINAMGGVPANDYERGHNDAIGDVLTMLEADILAARRSQSEDALRGRQAA